MGEIVHNTDEQVRDYIEKSLALLEVLWPPEDLRVSVFDKACNLYSSKSIVQQAPPAIGHGGFALPPNARGRRG